MPYSSINKTLGSLSRESTIPTQCNSPFVKDDTDLSQRCLNFGLLKCLFMIVLDFFPYILEIILPTDVPVP